MPKVQSLVGSTRRDLKRSSDVLEVTRARGELPAAASRIRAAADVIEAEAI
jgi:hypothetical protein